MSKALLDPTGVLSHAVRVHLGLMLTALLVVHLGWGMGPELWGVLSGGLLAWSNLAGLKWLARRLGAAPLRSRGFYVMLFFGKLSILFVVVVAILALLPVDPLAFLVGLSFLVLALLGAAGWQALAPAQTSHGTAGGQL